MEILHIVCVTLIVCVSVFIVHKSPWKAEFSLVFQSATIKASTMHPSMWCYFRSSMWYYFCTSQTYVVTGTNMHLSTVWVNKSNHFFLSTFSKDLFSFLLLNLFQRFFLIFPFPPFPKYLLHLEHFRLAHHEFSGVLSKVNYTNPEKSFVDTKTLRKRFPRRTNGNNSSSSSILYSLSYFRDGMLVINSNTRSWSVSKLFNKILLL